MALFSFGPLIYLVALGQDVGAVLLQTAAILGHVESGRQAGRLDRVWHGPCCRLHAPAHGGGLYAHIHHCGAAGRRGGPGAGGPAGAQVRCTHAGRFERFEVCCAWMAGTCSTGPGAALLPLLLQLLLLLSL